MPTPHLNGHHTIFGRVIEGQDVVDAISMTPRDERQNSTTFNRPLEDVVIESVAISPAG